MLYDRTNSQTQPVGAHWSSERLHLLTLPGIVQAWQGWRTTGVGELPNGLGLFLELGVIVLLGLDLRHPA